MAEVTNIEEFEDGSARITIDLTERETKLLLSDAIERIFREFVQKLGEVDNG